MLVCVYYTWGLGMRLLNLLLGSLLKTVGGESLVTVERKLSTFGASIFRRQSTCSYNVIFKWYYEGIHLSPLIIFCLIASFIACEVAVYTIIASSPGPSPPPPPPPNPEERPGTHCLRTCEIFRYIFRKKLHALVRMRKPRIQRFF